MEPRIFEREFLFVWKAENRVLGEESGLWMNLGWLFHPLETSIKWEQNKTEAVVSCTPQRKGCECSV